MTDKLLNEGMRAGDLEDLVLPMVSVDEFVSKIDDDAIVFGFFVGDSEAAQDLNRFVQKSSVPLLDSEVSPAPDEYGYYFVFFELLQDDDLPENVGKVLDEVSELTKIDSWQLRVRGLKDLIPFSHKALAQLPGDEEESETPLEEQIFRFLTPSDLSSADISGDVIFLEGRGHVGYYKIVAFADDNEINLKFSLRESADDWALKNVAKQNRLLHALGEGWNVRYVQGFYKLMHEESERILLLTNR